VFVLLSKTFDLFLAPLTWALVLAFAGLLLRRRRARGSTALWLSALALLWGFSTEPVANGLMRHAEKDAPRSFRPEIVYDAVIVLGGAVDNDLTGATDRLDLNGAAERFLTGFELVRTGAARHVLITGGTLVPRADALIEADLLARQLETWGVPPEQLVSENKSRNTRENATESARIARERGWQTLVLVTSAAQMVRAVGCFRAAGLSPDALPVDYRAYDPSRRSGSWLPRASSLAMSTDALRELSGRLVYHALGYAH